VIVASHPDDPPEAQGLRAIGYWRSERQDGLPRPQDFVDPAWDPRLRALASLYLRNASAAVSWRGSSSCRFSCKERNGSRCMSDGVFIWPEGLVHYVDRHSVRLPDEFMDHVVARMRSGDFSLEGAVREARVRSSLLVGSGRGSRS